MEAVVIHSLQMPLKQALITGNSVATQFVSPYLLTSTEPIQPAANSIWPSTPVGHGGEYVPGRIFLMPYGQGNPGAQFSMRLLGWRTVGADPTRVVWFPLVLVELLCTLGAIPGPSPLPEAVSSSESMCDDLSLTNGAVGNFGEVVTFGAGSGIIAFADVDLRGCQKWSFDFQGDGNESMNCLWARL